MATTVIIALVGGIALLGGVFGGGAEAGRVKLVPIPGKARVAAGLLGAGLLGWAIWLATLEAGSTVAAARTPPVLVNLAPEGEVEVSSASDMAGTECQRGVKATDGIAAGFPTNPCNEWASEWEKVGAWLKITFAEPKNIHLVVLRDRPNQIEHILDGTLEFSDGTQLKTGELPNDGSPQAFSFDSTKAISWVRFTVDRAEGLNIGLSEIEVFGWPSE